MGKGAPENLRPINTLTKDEQKRITTAGGKASGEARRRRKTLREELLCLLEQGDTQERISLAQLQRAMQGDTRAFEVIRDTIGERQAETVDTTVKIVMDGETGDFAK